MTEFMTWLMGYCQSQMSGMDVPQLVLFIWSICWLVGFGTGFLWSFIASVFIDASL